MLPCAFIYIWIASIAIVRERDTSDSSRMRIVPAPNDFSDIYSISATVCIPSPPFSPFSPLFSQPSHILLPISYSPVAACGYATKSTAASPLSSTLRAYEVSAGCEVLAVSPHTRGGAGNTDTYYKQLQQLHQRYSAQGFRILAFPYSPSYPQSDFKRRRSAALTPPLPSAAISSGGKSLAAAATSRSPPTRAPTSSLA
jgi:hypothetical protein